MFGIFSSKVAVVLAATFLLTILFSIPASAQDCTPDDIVLGSQADVDNFQLNHGPCDRVVNDLTIEGVDILNLDGLAAVTSVDSLIISNNSALTNVDGLAALTSINDVLQISHNQVLIDMDGLSSLTSVGGSITIWDNFELTSVDGLSRLTNVSGDLFIRDNSTLSDLDGLTRINRVSGSLGIESNGNLRNLDGLNALTMVGDVLRIQTEELLNLDGLSNVTRVGGTLIIFDTSLTEVDGLSGINSVGGDIWIVENPELINLDGLSLVPAVQNLLVEENSSLADCQGLARLVDPIDHYETGPGPGSAGIPDIADMATVRNNLDGCNSVLEILRDVDFFEINAGLNDAWFDPENPGQGFLIIVLPAIKQIFLAWFTYDTERPPEDVTAFLGEPGHRWLTAQGQYEENLAALDIFETSGGVFDSQEPVPFTEPDGQILLEFSNCNAGTITYDIPSVNRQGVIPIERIALDNVSLCYFLGNPAVNAIKKSY